MINQLNRRQFLSASAALAGATLLPSVAAAQSSSQVLRATTATLDIAGRAASVYRLLNANGGSGITLDPGQRFQIALNNELAEPTLIHWHGQIPPNLQDGVPDMPMAPLQPGEERHYDYAPQAGTHWMHSHIPVQEMQLLAAPLIIRSAEDVAADRQEVVMFLHDFSFRPADEVLAEITGGASMTAGMAHGAMGMQADPDLGGHDMGAMGMSGNGMAGMDMPGMVMDLNDFNFDAYLANDRTLSDPEVVAVENGGRIRLRIVNAAAATVFWIDTGAVEGRLVAVDGHPVQPLKGRRFGVAMAQRLDVELDLPSGATAFPVLALREGASEQTGIILAAPGATVTKLAGLADIAAPAFDRDLAQESALRAIQPLADRPVDKADMLMLTGAMQPYLWTINGQSWGTHTPVTAKSGQRVELTFHNMSMMAHPMHLHGHAFQVVGINGQRVAGAVRDTVLVPPMAMVSVAIDAGEAARWMLHCHHMPHLATGMMTEFAISA